MLYTYSFENKEIVSITQVNNEQNEILYKYEVEKR